MLNLLMRAVPEALLAGVKKGDLSVAGSVIRSVASGRIVGHLQETSAMQQVVTRLLSDPTGPVDLGVNLVGHAVTHGQLRHLNAAVGRLGVLQGAGLALGGIGIGVSLASAAVLSRQVARLEASVDTMAERLERLARGVEMLRLDRIASDLDRLRALSGMAEEAWRLTNATSQWTEVATGTHHVATAFERRATETLGDSDIAASEPFLAALALAWSLRVTARFALGDDAAAQAAAVEGAELLHGMTADLDFGSIVRKALSTHDAQPGTPGWKRAVQDAADFADPFIEAARARACQMAGLAETAGALARQGISGTAWLAAARAEEDDVLLFLPDDTMPD